jgi:hypothetical protein
VVCSEPSCMDGTYCTQHSVRAPLRTLAMGPAMGPAARPCHWPGARPCALPWCAGAGRCAVAGELRSDPGGRGRGSAIYNIGYIKRYKDNKIQLYKHAR